LRDTVAIWGRVETTAFVPPRDRLVLDTNDARVLALARRLWPEATTGAGEDAIRMRIEVAGGAAPGELPERRLAWTHTPDEFRCEIPGLFASRIDIASASIAATASSGFLGGAPDLAARSLLEAPVAVLLARRGWRALHAGAVAGTRGAVVLRGGSGAGKSTLVAAAYAAGLQVLGDESVLVARDDADALASSVRELTVREDSARLLGLLGRTAPAFTGGEEKRRVDLFADSRPESRAARRLATLLLGPRTPGPARLVPLSPKAFLEEFAKGEIPQEHVTDGASAVACAWAEAGGSRLDGTSDLARAVALLKSLVD
jgi:hypothetical protein